MSHEHGTIYAKKMEADNSTCTQFEVVATNITGTKYIDKTPEVENNHQDILVLNLEDYDKKIALYLIPEILACKMRCASTQISNIFVCPRGDAYQRQSYHGVIKPSIPTPSNQYRRRIFPPALHGL